MGVGFARPALAAGLWMLLLWVFQFWKRDAGIVDAGWALGLFGAALFFALDASAARRRGIGDGVRRRGSARRLTPGEGTV